MHFYLHLHYITQKHAIFTHFVVYIVFFKQTTTTNTYTIDKINLEQCQLVVRY